MRNKQFSDGAVLLIVMLNLEFSVFCLDTKVCSDVYFYHTVMVARDHRRRGIHMIEIGKGLIELVAGLFSGFTPRQKFCGFGIIAVVGLILFGCQDDGEAAESND